MLTASQLIVERLAKLGIRQAFGVVGGAIMYITDALRQSTAIRSTFLHHEQAAAIAAEAYGKLENRPALVFATAGPGVTNLLTGVADAYMDSVPMVVLVGDVRTTIRADFATQRYNAPQEVDQRALLEPIVKEYLCVEPSLCAETIIDEVDRIVTLACAGRPGPVCIALPLDAQGGKFEAAAALASPPSHEPQGYLDEIAARRAVTALASAQSPLLVLGAGVRLARAEAATRDLVRAWQVPYCVTIGAVDLQDAEDELSVGCVGPTSQRAANLALQAADCVLVLASSLDQSVTGFNIDAFTRDKQIHLLNVDAGEFLRIRNTSVQCIEGYLRTFCKWVSEHATKSPSAHAWAALVNQLKNWLDHTHERAMRTTVNPHLLSAYDISRRISERIPQRSQVVLGISLDAHSVFNAFRVRKGHRIIVSRNLGPMGWDLPAVIGAATTESADTARFLITGDGSIMLNLQELAVICGARLPICIFVFSNDGYVSIRTTQSNFFDREFFGCDSGSGLHIPSFEHLATGFGIAYDRLHSLDDIDRIIESHVAAPRPRLVECPLDPAQLREPRLVSRVVNGKFVTPSLADMTPRLSESDRARVLSLFPQLAMVL